jgi:hypothetical protein
MLWGTYRKNGRSRYFSMNPTARSVYQVVSWFWSSW